MRCQMIHHTPNDVDADEHPCPDMATALVNETVPACHLCAMDAARDDLPVVFCTPPLATTTYENRTSSTDLYAMRSLVAFALSEESREWRHHGVGMLQSYIDTDLRVHVWYPKLVVEGMEDSGGIHDHRFDLSSTVLIGNITNREFRFGGFEGSYACKARNYEMYEVENCSSGKTDPPLKCRAAPMPIFYKDVLIDEGQRYTYPAGAFHQSLPNSPHGFVITLVHKTNQQERRARLLAPVGVAPTHAFAKSPLSDADRKLIIQTAHEIMTMAIERYHHG